MTRDELLADLRRAQELDDTEAAHAWADDALLDYINDPEVTRAYGDIKKWYA